MSKKTKIPADPHSEAALKWCVKNWSDVYISDALSEPVIYVKGCWSDGHVIVAAIDLRDIIKKRQPLTGVKKQMAGIVRGKRKKVRK